MKNVVVIGGGSGLSTIMRGLKQLENVNLSAIVTVSDDGGSTGRIREQFQIPAMGDIRNVMCAMAEDEGIFTELVNYRFDGEGDIGGHNLGNLILTALTQRTGNFIQAIETFSKVLKVNGKIIPSSLEMLTLFAQMEDGTIVRGESNIPSFDNHIHRVFYDHGVEAYKEAVSAIQKADYIFYGIGSLYTSIMPNLIIGDICDALQKSTATKIYICNAMSEPGETDDYFVEDHVDAILNHVNAPIIDAVITYNQGMVLKHLDNYQRIGSFPVLLRDRHHSYKVLERDLLTFDHQLIRHDFNKIKDMVSDIINGEVEI